jgi:hypothetical protein
VNERKINKNAGAESTIEALLALFYIENDSVALEKLCQLINEEGMLKNEN